MLKILFIGDVYGKLGRETIKKLLPKAQKEHKPDIIIVNAENIAHGSGVTVDTIEELMSYGVDFITLGDHAFDRPEQIKTCFEKNLPIIRPANFPDTLPGVGHKLIKTTKDDILIISLLGRVNMNFQYDCPFKTIDKILTEYNLAKIKPSAIIVDIHAETTAEKVCFGFYLDGKVSAIIGTHTHIPTADARILPKGSGYITDAGMTGAYNESIGIELNGAIKSLIDQVKYPRTIPEKGEVIMSGAIITIEKNKTKEIKQLSYFDKIK